MNFRYHTIGIAITLGSLLITSSSSKTQIQLQPTEATKTQLQPIVKDILAAWDKFDVVCLGEDHGSKNDSDLRITLIEHPDFLRKVHVIMVEFAGSAHQDLLDRLVLEGQDIPREQLKRVWTGSSGTEVWQSPIYETFLRAVRKINLTVPRNQRVRVLAGDNFQESNRGKVIRDAISREILEKRLKGLAIYGAGHCERRAMGFPGELEDRYPGRIWSAFTFYDVDEGRRVFGLGDTPSLIPIVGTDKAKLAVGKMFFLGRYNDPSTLNEIANAIVYYGNIRDAKVPAEKR
jgi:uncharacterized iron-regulated protein